MAKKNLELRRQLVHASGILLVLPLILFGKIAAILVTGVFFITFLFLAFCRKEKSMWILKYFFKTEEIENELSKYERGHENLGGAITFFIGVLIVLIGFHMTAAIAAISVLALADSASTLVGKRIGKHRIPLNRKKSFEGSFAFLLVSYLVLQFFLNPAKALIMAIAVTFVEMIPIDDNLTIPLTIGILFNFI